MTEAVRMPQIWASVYGSVFAREVERLRAAGLTLSIPFALGIDGTAAAVAEVAVQARLAAVYDAANRPALDDDEVPPEVLEKVRDLERELRERIESLRGRT